jgi:Ni/Co efflux regulator RcnB
VVRTIWLATAACAALAGTAAPAAAQRVWQDGRWVSMPHRSTPAVGRVERIDSPHRDRWPQRNGRWRAGWDAPGGWNGYHRLNRGSRIDRYWMDHRIPDYLSFGLSAPPRGYGWVRYYDDAVLVDDYGQVWDSVGGIGWDGDAYAEASGSYASARGGYAAPIAPVDPNAYYDDRGYDAPPIAPEPYYPEPYGSGYEPPMAPPVAPPVQVQTYPGGAYQGGAFLGGNAYGGAAYGSSYYAGGGYAYGGGTTTTVIITPAPIVTTTTTTVTEEVVSTGYVRPAKRVLRKAPVKRYRRCGC